MTRGLKVLDGAMEINGLLMDKIMPGGGRAERGEMMFKQLLTVEEAINAFSLFLASYQPKVQLKRCGSTLQSRWELK